MAKPKSPANTPQPLPKVRGTIEWGNPYMGYSVRTDDGRRLIAPSPDAVVTPKSKSKP